MGIGVGCIGGMVWVIIIFLIIGQYFWVFFMMYGNSLLGLFVVGIRVCYILMCLYVFIYVEFIYFVSIWRF